MWLAALYKWLFATWLAAQAHFAASYLVPLDENAQHGFGGLLRWLWPWSMGDRGALGMLGPSETPLPTLLLAITAASLLGMAALATVGWWVPQPWCRFLAVLGAGLSIVLFVLFISPTKLLPIASAVAIIALVVSKTLPRTE